MLGRTVYGATFFTCIAGMAADVLAGAALEFCKGKTVRILVGASAGGPLTLGDACLGDNRGSRLSAIARGDALPPGTPKDPVQLLRKAYFDTLVSTDMQADVQQARLSSNPATGEELQKIVEGLFKLPPAIANKLKDVFKYNPSSVRWAGKRRDFLISIIRSR